MAADRYFINKLDTHEFVPQANFPAKALQMSCQALEVS